MHDSRNACTDEPGCNNKVDDRKVSCGRNSVLSRNFFIYPNHHSHNRRKKFQDYLYEESQNYPFTGFFGNSHFNICCSIIYPITISDRFSNNISKPDYVNSIIWAVAKRESGMAEMGGRFCGLSRRTFDYAPIWWRGLFILCYSDCNSFTRYV